MPLPQLASKVSAHTLASALSELSHLRGTWLLLYRSCQAFLLVLWLLKKPMSRLVIACVLRAKSSIGSCPKGGIVSFPYDKTPVLLLYEITSTTNWDVAFDVSLRYDATSTERRALRSMERTAVAPDVPSAGMAEASAETMARDRMKFIVIKL